MTVIQMWFQYTAFLLRFHTTNHSMVPILSAVNETYFSDESFLLKTYLQTLSERIITSQADCERDHTILCYTTDIEQEIQCWQA